MSWNDGSSSTDKPSCGPGFKFCVFSLHPAWGVVLVCPSTVTTNSNGGRADVTAWPYPVQWVSHQVVVNGRCLLSVSTGWGFCWILLRILFFFPRHDCRCQCLTSSVLLTVLLRVSVNIWFWLFTARGEMCFPNWDLVSEKRCLVYFNEIVLDLIASFSSFLTKFPLWPCIFPQKTLQMKLQACKYLL